jgi:hypothetical protein
MLVINLLLLAICMAAIFVGIHNQDEVHQLVAFLSGLIALVCIVVLSPAIVKILLALIVFFLGQKILPTPHKF